MKTERTIDSIADIVSKRTQLVKQDSVARINELTNRRDSLTPEENRELKMLENELEIFTELYNSIVIAARTL